MADRIGEQLADQRVVLDEDEFLECTFTRCQIVYRGGERAYLVRCRFAECSFEFEGAAGRTLLFLRNMYRSMGPAGAQLVERTFDEIRRPGPDVADTAPVPQGGPPDVRPN